jgi:hypothetical protein
MDSFEDLTRYESETMNKALARGVLDTVLHYAGFRPDYFLVVMDDDGNRMLVTNMDLDDAARLLRQTAKKIVKAESHEVHSFNVAIPGED